MILAIDIGNTTVALGGIKDGRVCFVAHMDTVRTRTAAEYRAAAAYMRNCGITDGFVQERTSAEEAYTPAFDGQGV